MGGFFFLHQTLQISYFKGEKKWSGGSWQAYLKLTSLHLGLPKFYFSGNFLFCKINKLINLNFFGLLLLVFQWITVNVNAKEPFSIKNSWNNIKILHIIKLRIYKSLLLDSLQGNLLLIIKPWTTTSAEYDGFNSTDSYEQILLW